MRNLGELEAAVMDLMWAAREPLTVREVLPLLDREPPLAYTTVLTVMDNLHKKGFLSREKQGRAFLYWATQDRAAYSAELMHELLSDSGDSRQTLLRFVDAMTPAELRRLKRVLGD